MPRTVLLARLAGAIAVVASVALFLRVAAIGEVDETTIWVFGLAAVAGGLAIARPANPSVLMGACVVLVVALLPAVRSWVALLYLPALGLMAWATLRASAEHSRRIRSEGYDDDGPGEDDEA
jgi:hypothetical protein